MKNSKLPDETFSGQNVDEGGPIVEIAGYSITEWTPERDGKGKPEMVFLALDIPILLPIQLVMRFKGPIEITRMIEGLIRHRDGVWPKDA